MGGGASILLLVLALLLFRSARHKAEVLATKNAEIIQAQTRLIESEKQREAEQVRTRIARDIHDEVGSELTRISMLGGEVKRRLSPSESAANEGLDQIRLLTRQVSATLSDVVWAVDHSRTPCRVWCGMPRALPAVCSMRSVIRPNSCSPLWERIGHWIPS
ncbi:MAG: hypothetical protein IPO90_14015 [Flavobacteriales bacterium]|nr:hypothetical protein [Flavobacteriales bacterium]